MNKILLFLLIVFFTSCSTYYNTPNAQSYTTSEDVDIQNYTLTHYNWSPWRFYSCNNWYGNYGWNTWYVNYGWNTWYGNYGWNTWYGNYGWNNWYGNYGWNYGRYGWNYYGWNNRRNGFLNNNYTTINYFGKYSNKTINLSKKENVSITGNIPKYTQYQNNSLDKKDTKIVNQPVRTQPQPPRVNQPVRTQPQPPRVNQPVRTQPQPPRVRK